MSLLAQAQMKSFLWKQAASLLVWGLVPGAASRPLIRELTHSLSDLFSVASHIHTISSPSLYRLTASSAVHQASSFPRIFFRSHPPWLLPASWGNVMPSLCLTPRHLCLSQSLVRPSPASIREKSELLWFAPWPDGHSAILRKTWGVVHITSSSWNFSGSPRLCDGILSRSLVFTT